MRRWLILQVVALLLLTTTVTQAQEPHVRARARAYERLIAEAAARHGVDPRLLWVIAYQETRFQPGLISPKGARGLMQFMPGTAARYGLLNPHDPAPAIDAAARYVRDLTARFGGRLDLVLAGYNAGEGAVEAFRAGRKLILPTGKVINAAGLKTGGVPPYRETQEYVSNSITLFSNITSTGIFNSTQWARVRPVIMPVSKRSLTQIAEPMPDEINQKQGSIYMTDAIEVGASEDAINDAGDKSIDPHPEPFAASPAATKTPAPKISATRSIYF